MDIVIVSATEFETLPLIDYLKEHFKNKDNIRFFNNKLDIRLLVTGVGPVHTTFQLATYLSKIPCDLAINLGIAGAINTDLKIGEVVQVVSEQFGDIGVEEANGNFTDLFEMGLCEKNDLPYENGKLLSPYENPFLKQVNGLTVSKVHGTEESISKIKNKYNADIESMEGAAFVYCCKMHKVSHLQIRSISNFVEPRNKDNWDIPLAIDNLNRIAIEVVELLNQ